MIYQNNQDTQLSCADCGQDFNFSADDKEFYAQKGYSNPKRCPSCRASRKNNDSRRGGGGGGGFRGASKPRYDVTCSECGCETTVPFEPKHDRPVYCSDCYKKSY